MGGAGGEGGAMRTVSPLTVLELTSKSELPECGQWSLIWGRNTGSEIFRW